MEDVLEWNVGGVAIAKAKDTVSPVSSDLL